MIDTKYTSKYIEINKQNYFGFVLTFYFSVINSQSCNCRPETDEGQSARPLIL